MNDKVNLEVTIKPALTVERIREELADMVGLKLNPDTNAEIVRRLNAIGLFDFSVKAEPSCTDERPCVSCFSGQGECEVGPYGGPELLEQARALCRAIERLPAGENQTRLISKVADATFALQNLQSTGDYFWPRPVDPTLAAQDVLAERRRQVEVEGWTPEHDDRHNSHELAEAAACYSLAGVGKQFEYFQMMWPWEPYWFKGGDQRRMLVKAGALLLAEIERLDRQSAAAATPDDLTQFLEQTDFDAAEKVASSTVDNQQALPAGEDDCEGCKI